MAMTDGRKVRDTAPSTDFSVDCESKKNSLRKRLSSALSHSLNLKAPPRERRERLAKDVARYINEYSSEVATVVEEDEVRTVLTMVLSTEIVWYDSACFSCGATDGFIEAFFRTIHQEPYLLSAYLDTLVKVACTMNPFAEQQSHHIEHIISASCRLLTLFPAAREGTSCEMLDKSIHAALCSAMKAVGSVAMGRSFVAFSLLRASVEARKRTACSAILRDMIALIIPEDLVIAEIYGLKYGSRSLTCTSTAVAASPGSAGCIGTAFQHHSNAPTVSLDNVPLLIDQVARRINEIFCDSNREQSTGRSRSRLMAWGLDSGDSSAWLYYNDDEDIAGTTSRTSNTSSNGETKKQKSSSWFLEELKLWEKLETVLATTLSSTGPNGRADSRRVPRSLNLLDMTVYRVITWFETWQSVYRMRNVVAAIFNNYAIELFDSAKLTIGDIFDDAECLWDFNTLNPFLPLWIRGSWGSSTSLTMNSRISALKNQFSSPKNKMSHMYGQSAEAFTSRVKKFKSFRACFTVHRFLLTALVGGAARASLKLSDLVQLLTQRISSSLCVFADGMGRDDGKDYLIVNTGTDSNASVTSMTAKSLMESIILIETLMQLLSHTCGGILEDSLVLSILRDLTAMAVSMQEHLQGTVHMHLHASTGSDEQSTGSSSSSQYALTHVAVDVVCSAIAYVVLHRFGGEEKVALLQAEDWSHELVALFRLDNPSVRVAAATAALAEAKGRSKGQKERDKDDSHDTTYFRGHPVLSLLLGVCVLPHITHFEFPAAVLSAYLDQLQKLKSDDVILGCDFSEVDISTLFRTLPLSSSVVVHLAAQWPYRGKHDTHQRFNHIKALAPNPHTLSATQACAFVESALSNLYESLYAADGGEDEESLRGKRRAMATAFSADVVRHIMSFMTFKRVCRLACVSTLFAASAKAPVLWRGFFAQKYPKTKFESSEELSVRCGIVLDEENKSGGNTPRLSVRSCCQRCFPQNNDQSSGGAELTPVPVADDDQESPKEKVKASKRPKKSRVFLACSKLSDDHDWLTLFKERALATRNHAVSKALKAGANACIVCPFIGCTAVIRADKNKNQVHMKLHGIVDDKNKKKKKTATTSDIDTNASSISRS